MFKVQKINRNYRTKSIRLSESLLKRIEKVSKREKVGVNELIRQCIEYALNDMGDEQ